MANPLIEVKDVNAFYGDAQALWDVGFSIEEGEVFSIIGSNGAGKSTILTVLSGLLKPTSGEIRFAGSSMVNMSPSSIVDRGISFVPEGRGVFTSLTVKENMELGAFVKRARPLKRETLKQIYDIFPIIRERPNQLVGKMSGGQQQMIAIAKALMSNPKLLMLDEPSLGLAPIIVKEVFEVIKRLKEQGVTILLVEQNIHQALRIADHACVIKTGEISLMGTGSELLSDTEIRNAYMGSLK